MEKMELGGEETKLHRPEKMELPMGFPVDMEALVALSKAGTRNGESQARDSHIPMPLLNTPYLPGHCMDAIQKIEDPDTGRIALAEYYYFRGQAEKASDLAEPYLVSEDLGLRASACWIYAYANLTLDRIANVQKVLGLLEKSADLIHENMPVEHKALVVFMGTAASTLLHLPAPKDLPPLQYYIRFLPKGLRFFALYVQSHIAYLEGQYGVSVGIAETGFALEDEVYPIPFVYLHLMCAISYVRLDNLEQAKAHLLQAWKLAQPDDMIEAFAEHHGLLSGLLEVEIKKESPQDFRRIIGITYRFASGWRKIHNPATGRSVADNLTTTEFTVAMLVARNWTNKEIGAHLGISANTVKAHISSALQKLGISQRKELQKFMLK